MMDEHLMAWRNLLSQQKLDVRYAFHKRHVKTCHDSVSKEDEHSPGRLQKRQPLGWHVVGTAVEADMGDELEVGRTANLHRGGTAARVVCATRTVKTHTRAFFKHVS